MDFNHVVVVGGVTADPELRSTPSGQSVAHIGVATNRTWTGKDGAKQEEVEFHNVVLWGKQADVAKNYLQKGSIVLIEGRLHTRTWTDKDGQQRRATEIVCDHMQLGPKPQGASAAAKPPAKAAAPAMDRDMPVVSLDEEEIKPEDIPF
jgi:single-strand DNA-binding protein